MFTHKSVACRSHNGRPHRSSNLHTLHRTFTLPHVKLPIDPPLRKHCHAREMNFDTNITITSRHKHTYSNYHQSPQTGKLNRLIQYLSERLRELFTLVHELHVNVQDFGFSLKHKRRSRTINVLQDVRQGRVIGASLTHATGYLQASRRFGAKKKVKGDRKRVRVGSSTYTGVPDRNQKDMCV